MIPFSQRQRTRGLWLYSQFHTLLSSLSSTKIEPASCYSHRQPSGAYEDPQASPSRSSHWASRQPVRFGHEPLYEATCDLLLLLILEPTQLSILILGRRRRVERFMSHDLQVISPKCRCNSWLCTSLMSYRRIVESEFTYQKWICCQLMDVSGSAAFHTCPCCTFPGR
jgi:hypothetical protein